MESQLASMLLQTLSADALTRRHAENELESVLSSPDAGIAFASLALAEEADGPLRQISGVMLKKFMDKWWDVLGDNNGLTDEQKAQLLPLLFNGLSLPSSKLRSQFAFSLSIPLLNPPATSSLDESSGVLAQLLGLLAQGTQDQVHGAMRVFQEVVRKGELDLGDVAGGGGSAGNNGADERVLGLVRGLGPVLLGVLGNEAHSASTRASSIAVFRQCLYTLFMLKEQLPTLASDTVGQVLPPWLDAFVVLLGHGDLTAELRDGGREGWEGLMIKMEIFKTLDTIFRSFPRTLPATLLLTILPLSINHLTKLLPFHTLYSLSSTSSVSPPSSTDPSADGDDITIEQVACPIIDFLMEVTRAGKLVKGWTEARQEVETMALKEVVGAVLGFTMMTTEEEEEWANDPNAFVMEEDDETDLYSLRIAGHDFISTLLEKYPKPTARVLHEAVQWRIGASQIERTNEDPDWWKGLEASLACVGGVSEVLLEILEEEETVGGTKSFDLRFLFDEVIPKFLAAQDLPFLQGRSFVVASQYSTALAPALAAQYLDAAVQVLEAPGMSVSVKISAVKTIKNFCRHLPATTVKPLSHRVLSTLVPLITQAGEEVLALILESLRAVVGVDEDALEPTLMGQLTDVLLDVWAKNVKDMIIASIFEELFEHLASTPSTAAYVSLMQHALPKLCTAISAASPGASEDPVAAAVLAAGAIEVVSGLVRGRSGPIDPSGEGYVAGLGRVLFPSLLEGEDMEMVQNGTQALTLLIRKDCNALLQSTDPSTGRTGLDSVFGVISRLLRPGQSESRGLFLGDLVVHLLRTSGQQVAPVLPELIKAMVARIPTATYAMFQQSLIVPIAYLIHTQFDATLSILETTPVEGPDGGGRVPALDVLLKSWAENAETFQGSWAVRVSTLALADLFASERQSLAGVGVRGEMIQDPATAGIIMTRSMTKSRPIVFSSVAFPLKALKLILLETKAAKANDDYNTSWDFNEGEDEDEDEDDDGADWADDGPSLVKSTAKPVDEFGFLSDMMGAGGDDEGSGFDNEDEDLRNDPVSTIDMNSHLQTLLRTAYERMDSFGSLAGQLNDDERTLLGGILA